MFGAITYLPQYMQIVRGASPTGSGLDLLPLMAGLLLTSITSGLLITKWGRYKVFPVVGTALMTIGMYLLSRLAVGTGTLTSSIYMFVLGVGIGGVMQVLVIAVQNAVSYKDLGVATSGATFFRSIGGSFGTAIFGAIFASQLDRNLVHFLAGTPVPAGFHGSAGASPASLAKLPAAVHAGYIEAFSTSLHTVFLVATPIAAVGFVVSLFLKEVPLRKTTQATDPADSLAPSAKPAVRSSLDEVERALTVLMSRESKVKAYERLAASTGLDLDPQSIWMLLRLNEHPDGDLDQVARGQGVSPETYAPIIRTLSDRGLTAGAATSVNGQPGPSTVRLSDQGRIDATALVAAQREVLSELLGDWSPEEHTELAALLTRLANQFADDPVPAS
jgi:MFS family permease